ncbi:hypothetical protein [Streptomyces uncialis]|uniref:hypothetical protein n=1 Tax=Streptomyces uncialis TaxID=1048205 RepID=UPI0022583A99|nr:hypothetical protein [Streptomyces uncialis]MCX4663481.1 hypothetical protein [Streptomyces uncialis]
MSQTEIWVTDAFLFLYAFMIARSREIHAYQVIIIIMAGFLLAMTPLGYPLWATIGALFDMFG